MKKIKSLLIILIGVICFNSCGDFGDINVDPNNPSTPDTRFLFTQACKQVRLFVMVGTYGPWNQMYPQYFAERQNVQYSNFTLMDFNTGAYYRETIKNLNAIINMNSNSNTKDATHVIGLGSVSNQIAMCRTLRAFIYMHLTDVLGMIPYSEALKGDEGLFTPKYDTQEFIYQDLDRDLKEAYAQFNTSEALNSTYDILFKGNVDHWKKLNASIRMMLAIKLSDVAPNDGKARFATAFADGGMTNNSELLSYKYLPETANQSPLYDNIMISGRKDFAPSKTILDFLLQYKDPRIEAYAEPNTNGDYDGVPFGTIQADIATYANTATFDPRYFKQDATYVLISPSHILLIEAEAAVRGWITANAEDLYKAGIKASFDQYGIVTANFVTWGLADINAYYAQTDIAFTGTDDQKISKIAMQRYLANFMQDGIEAWSDIRRLHIPALLPGNAASSMTHVPYRRIYYPDDYGTNRANYDAAIAAQGADNFDTRVWWDTH